MVFFNFLGIPGLNNLDIIASDVARCHCLYLTCDGKRRSSSFKVLLKVLPLRDVLFSDVIKIQIMFVAFGNSFIKKNRF